MRESTLFVLAIAVLVGANLFWVNRNYDLSEKDNVVAPQKTEISSVSIASKEIKIELADSQEEQRQGLSGRESLAEDAGMLFVFPESAQYGFWMKDMKFSIDMIWLSDDGRVVYIEKSAKPESYPGVFRPDQKAKYVLEVNAGFAEKNNLKVGDGVEFKY